MKVSVQFSAPLRKLVAGKAQLTLSGETIAEVIASVESSYPGVRAHLLDESGGIRRFVNIYLNEEDIRYLKGLATPIEKGDKVSILQAVAGG